MRSIPIAEAKAHFSELVAAARKGEQVILTVRGKPVALLGPVPPPEVTHPQGNGAQPAAPSPVPVAPQPQNLTLAALLRSLRP